MNENEIIDDVASEKEYHDINNDNSLHDKLSELRKNLTTKTDKKSDTHLADIKPPKPIEKPEVKLAKVLENSKDRYNI